MYIHIHINIYSAIVLKQHPPTGKRIRPRKPRKPRECEHREYEDTKKTRKPRTPINLENKGKLNKSRLEHGFCILFGLLVRRALSQKRSFASCTGQHLWGKNYEVFCVRKRSDFMNAHQVDWPGTRRFVCGVDGSRCLWADWLIGDEWGQLYDRMLASSDRLLHTVYIYIYTWCIYLYMRAYVV